jgi:hypothetical protein
MYYLYNKRQGDQSAYLHTKNTMLHRIITLIKILESSNENGEENSYILVSNILTN